MYAPFFGLEQSPFSIAPDPRYLFMSERHREALAHLLYGLGGGGGFVLLTGEIGAGKTTVCRCWLEQIPPGCRVAYLFNPRLSATELLRSVCDEFHIDCSSPTPPTIKDYVDRLNAFLLATHAAGGSSLLIVDEAQQLSPDVLEQLRLLTNLETNERKLLQVVLIGQPELRDMLARPELEQLAQRVIARYHLEALSATETEQYIRHRLAVAGLAGPLPFDGAALRRIHRLARGVPRRINLLADRALLGAYATGRATVGRVIVDRAAGEVFDPRPRGVRAFPGPGRGMRSAVWLGAALAGAGLLTGAVLGVRWTSGSAVGGKNVSAHFGVSNSSASPVASAAAGARGDSGASAASSGSALAPAELASLTAASASRAGPPPPGAGIAEGSPTGSAREPGPGPTADPAAAPGGDAASTASAEGGGGNTGADFATEAAAWRALGVGWGLPATGGGDPCEAAQRQQVHCWRARTTLAVIRQLDRPGILTLQDARGRSGYALLIGLGGESATLILGGTPRALTLTELASRWRGDFATFWRAQPGSEGRTVDERAGPLPDWLLRQLEAATSARGSSPAPSGTRVTAFQIAQGLQPDGLAGPTTFMQLNRASGVAEPRLLPPGGGR